MFLMVILTIWVNIVKQTPSRIPLRVGGWTLPENGQPTPSASLQNMLCHDWNRTGANLYNLAYRPIINPCTLFSHMKIYLQCKYMYLKKKNRTFHI